MMLRLKIRYSYLWFRSPVDEKIIIMMRPGKIYRFSDETSKELLKTGKVVEPLASFYNSPCDLRRVA